MSIDPFEPLDPLEQRLGALRPVELPQELEERLAGAEPRRVRWLAYAIPLAAAAVWMIAAFIWSRGDSELASNAGLKPSDLRVYVPVEEKSTLVEVRDLGVLDTVPTRPVRLMQYTWIDDTTLRGDDGRSTLRRMEPREQIIPVVLEAF